ncbi:hypothetical protein [Kordia jejudonensis]|uniref:hypothetical protein n=1 Tax=Kordia jejudonensis TaxID=1348245 RepID=UPI000629B7DC|nr:hypothetical protein [Kordia jejudonensis]
MSKFIVLILSFTVLLIYLLIFEKEFIRPFIKDKLGKVCATFLLASILRVMLPLLFSGTLTNNLDYEYFSEPSLFLKTVAEHYEINNNVLPKNEIDLTNIMKHNDSIDRSIIILLDKTSLLKTNLIKQKETNKELIKIINEEKKHDKDLDYLNLAAEDFISLYILLKYLNQQSDNLDVDIMIYMGDDSWAQIHKNIDNLDMNNEKFISCIEILRKRNEDFINGKLDINSNFFNIYRKISENRLIERDNTQKTLIIISDFNHEYNEKTDNDFEDIENSLIGIEKINQLILIRFPVDRFKENKSNDHIELLKNQLDYDFFQINGYKFYNHSDYGNGLVISNHILKNIANQRIIKDFCLKLYEINDGKYISCLGLKRFNNHYPNEKILIGSDSKIISENISYKNSKSGNLEKSFIKNFYFINDDEIFMTLSKDEINPDFYIDIFKLGSTTINKIPVTIVKVISEINCEIIISFSLFLFISGLIIYCNLIYYFYKEWSKITRNITIIIALLVGLTTVYIIYKYLTNFSSIILKFCQFDHFWLYIITTLVLTPILYFIIFNIHKLKNEEIQ